MILINELMNIRVDLYEGEPSEIVFTDGEDYFRFLLSLKRAIELKDDESWIYSIDHEKASLSDQALLLTSPVEMPFTAAELKNAVIKDLLNYEFVVEDKLEKIRKLTDELFVDLSKYSAIPVFFETTISLKELIKSNKLEILDDIGTGLVEYINSAELICDWLKIGKQIFKKSLLITIDQAALIGDRTFKYQIEEAMNLGYHVLLLKLNTDNETISEAETLKNKTIIVL